MHYREQQLRLILKQHQNKWEKERDILQHDIWILENSTDLKLLTQAQEKQKELKKEIDTQQKELIARTREIWDLEKKQEQTFKELKEAQEQLTNKDNQLKEQKGVNALYNQKITDLDNQLINLAKQKIKNQKEAQILLNQLEKNWKAEKENWKNDKQELLKSWKQERDKQASQLAQERKEFYEKMERLQQVNQELTTNLTEKGTTITNHLTTIKDLETEITNQKTNLKNLEQKNQTKIKEIEQQNQVKHNRIVELEKELTTNNQQIAELKQAGREVRELLKSTKNQLQELKKQLGEEKVKNQKIEEEDKEREKQLTEWKDKQQKKLEKLKIILRDKSASAKLAWGWRSEELKASNFQQWLNQDILRQCGYDSEQWRKFFENCHQEKIENWNCLPLIRSIVIYQMKRHESAAVSHKEIWGVIKKWLLEKKFYTEAEIKLSEEIIPIIKT